MTADSGDVRSILAIALHEAASRGEFTDEPDHLLELLQPAVDEIVAGWSGAEQRTATAEAALHTEIHARVRDREQLLRMVHRAEAATVRAAERAAPIPLDRPHGLYVYRLWSADDELLYVGLSTNVLRRLGEHLEDPEKRALIHHITLIECDDEREMRRTEAATIRELRPAWNILGMAVSHG